MPNVEMAELGNHVMPKLSPLYSLVVTKPTGTKRPTASTSDRANR